MFAVIVKKITTFEAKLLQKVRFFAVLVGRKPADIASKKHDTIGADIASKSSVLKITTIGADIASKSSVSLRSSLDDTIGAKLPQKVRFLCGPR
ncbi:15616_t:CDS:2 [Funneliformis mosseae]|uniref:15616_t:CDS:1 n=1 Tax=Funneliformis mosseae TaxID=27381 RepID=A0A9N8W0E6_FUNMO|nr:15616_t:CDS:2 [Funneliformis mosseae]